MKILLFRLITLLFVLTISISCNSNSEDIKNHKQQVEKYRKQKDDDYKIPEKTMLTDELLMDFEGLKYYPIDYKYNIIAKLTKLEDLPKIEIKTSTGKILNYVIYGKLMFNIDNEPYELSVYQSARSVVSNRTEDVLFVPFTDQTSGDETYGGGRYLVLDILEGNELNVDFNMAYNPYCVYNAGHSCPIPPLENNLPVKIPVGEMMY